MCGEYGNKLNKGTVWGSLVENLLATQGYY